MKKIFSNTCFLIPLIFIFSLVFQSCEKDPPVGGIIGYWEFEKVESNWPFEMDSTLLNAEVLVRFYADSSFRIIRNGRLYMESNWQIDGVPNPENPNIIISMEGAPFRGIVHITGNELLMRSTFREGPFFYFSRKN